MRLAFVLIVLGLWSTVQAETVDSDRISTSISYLSSDTSEKRLELTDPDITQPLEKFGYREESSISAKTLSSKVCDCDVFMYDVSTILLVDNDFDGFYHRFKVIMDADTLFSPGLWVFAELYLSFEGGPWNHYATSGDFYIEGDTSIDEFVVETELVDGYPTGYYDIKIELYDAEYGDWILDYGPHDDASLNAIPLEERDRDDDYVYVSAGSTQFGFLALLVTLGLARAYSLTGKPALRQPRKPSA